MVRNQKGVTLVELTVALSIFAVLISISVGMFVAILNIQSQANNVRAVQQNMRFAFENFFRDVRLAQGFYDSGQETDFSVLCSDTSYLTPGFVSPNDDLNLIDPTKVFIIKNFRGEIVRYKTTSVGGRTVFVSENLGRPNCDTGIFEGEPLLLQLTGPDVSVSGLRVFRDRKYDGDNDGDGVNDNKRPPGLVTIRMGLGSFPTIPTRPALNQSMESEVTVSLRSEFCQFYPEACI